MRAANKPEYITGTGQKLWKIHAPELCQGRLCAIHNPTTEEPECNWPTHWRQDRGLMERICPCGIGHPAPEHMAYLEELDAKNGTNHAYYEGIHGCGLYCHTGGCREREELELCCDGGCEQCDNGWK